jgi:hypothetical protein
VRIGRDEKPLVIVIIILIFDYDDDNDYKAGIHSSTVATRRRPSR